MPTIFIINGFRFFFYSNENNEPIHIHILKANCNSKVWLMPEVDEAYSYGFSSGDRKFIMKTISSRRDEIIDKWNEYFKIR